MGEGHAALCTRCGAPEGRDRQRANRAGCKGKGLGAGRGRKGLGQPPKKGIGSRPQRERIRPVAEGKGLSRPGKKGVGQRRKGRVGGRGDARTRRNFFQAIENRYMYRFFQFANRRRERPVARAPETVQNPEELCRDHNPSRFRISATYRGLTGMERYCREACNRVRTGPACGGCTRTYGRTRARNDAIHTLWERGVLDFEG